MRRLTVFLLLLGVVLLAACQSAPAAPTSGLIPLVERPAPPTLTPATQDASQGTLIEVPDRVYDVPWQDRTLLEEGGFTFHDSTIPLFLYSQEEVDDALAKLEDYVQRELLDSDGALRYSEILSIAPDFLAASEYVSPENRKLEGINYPNWAQENYYSHYIDFDVIALCQNSSNWGESAIHVYNVGLFRDDAADPTGWRIRIMSREVFEPAYQDTVGYGRDGAAYPEPYRPLTYEELATLGDFGGRVLFATEMLYQENTTWVYVYLEDSDEIVRKEISYSNITAFIPTPALPK